MGCSQNRNFFVLEIFDVGLFLANPEPLKTVLMFRRSCLLGDGVLDGQARIFLIALDPSGHKNTFRDDRKSKFRTLKIAREAKAITFQQNLQIKLGEKINPLPKEEGILFNSTAAIIIRKLYANSLKTLPLRLHGLQPAIWS